MRSSTLGVNTKVVAQGDEWYGPGERHSDDTLHGRIGLSMFESSTPLLGPLALCMALGLWQNLAPWLATRLGSRGTSTGTAASKDGA